MSSFEKDYKKLYHLQDKFLLWWQTLGLPFYLTGGTALGRFYLNHRYSEDLDFFINDDEKYMEYIAMFKKKIEKQYTVNIQESLFTDDFTRIFINENNHALKIELVNDISYYPGKPVSYRYGLIDTALNILSNKITSIVGRDEPKDIFDIIHLSLNYSFNWKDVFYHSKQKSVINEIDVEQRLYSFPAQWLEKVNWLRSPVNLSSFEKHIKQVADDFLLGKDNSLGINTTPIEQALPINEK